VLVKDRTIITAAFNRPVTGAQLHIQLSGEKMYSTKSGEQRNQSKALRIGSVTASIMRGETMAMIARRLVVSLVLLALVCNVSVLAGVNSSTAAEAFALVSLKHETEGPLTRILIESSAPPLYTVFRPTDRLIVVDLPGGEASRLAHEYSVKSSLVDSIVVRQSRVGGNTAAGRSVTRIVVSVRAGSRDRSTVNGNTLVLEISPSVTATPAAAKVEKDTAAETKNAKRASQTRSDNKEVSGVMMYSAPARTVSAPESVKPRPSDLKPATLIRSVRPEAAGGAVRIVVDTDGTAQFKDFVLPNPWRIVVDITGVRSVMGNKIINVDSASVERLRVGQPSPSVVRIVLDTKSKVSYRVVREGAALVIVVGDAGSSRDESTKIKVDLKAQQDSKPANAGTQHKPEVKVAGDRIENKSDNKKPAAQGVIETITTSNLIAQNGSQSGGQRVTPQPNRSLPLPSQPAAQPSSGNPAVQTGQPAVNRSVMDVKRSPQPSTLNQPTKRSDLAFCDPGYVGGMISFDLRAGVDIRDMLRFVSQQYGVNFIIDKSVGPVPVDIRVSDIPWNHVIESVLRANRLGAVCESNGRIIRIATLSAVKEEEDQQRAILEAKSEMVPLTTKIVHLKYARAAGALGASGGGRSGGSGGGGGAGASGGGTAGAGTLMAIVKSRLSKRGKVEVDSRTNTLIITDLAEYTDVIEEMIAKLDRPEPQVEIEARIVIANRNFLRDVGVELAGGAGGEPGATKARRAGVFETTPAQFSGGNLAAGTGSSSGGGSGNANGGAGSAGSPGAAADTSKNPLGSNLLGPLADTALRAGVANTVLALTTGAIGTGILSLALSASETKGQIRTIASPRITTTDNKTAEIVNGVQIPVQTVSNNTITTTFVTAALRLEITPQIIVENGQVLMHVVAENNTVNFALAGQFNNGTPGINTQMAESTVLVDDGGTTVMGGINIDTEGHSMNRTPGVSRIPLLGELFKKRSTRRETDEILFFLTPRIVRNDGSVGPRVPQRSSVEGMPNPSAPQRAVVVPAPSDNKQDPKTVPAAVTAASGKAGQ
jgi:type IV pilus assembly protein PilQ